MKIYDFYVDLAMKKKWMPSNQEVSSVLQSTTQQLFVQQKVAMYQNGIWEVPNMRKMMPPGSKDFFEWDIALFPLAPVTLRASRGGPSQPGDRDTPFSPPQSTLKRHGNS